MPPPVGSGAAFSLLLLITAERLTMANCIYCGRPAGFLRRRHPACEERHKKVVALMPRFFSEVISSPISAERFSDLLLAATKASFVRPGELKSMCVSGINTAIDTILRERLLTSVEVQRITDLADALGAQSPRGLGLDQKLIKLSIVNELYDGKIPDRVSIVGPMPVELGRGESVLWIFNKVLSYRMTPDKKEEGLSIDPASPIESRYVSPKALDKSHVPKKQLREKADGDLVVTNRNIYFLPNPDSHIRIPISRIFSLRPYAEGFYVACRPVKERSRAFLLDDPWFATNVIGRLAQLAHR